ncbi:DsrE family protein [Flavobacteriaceae bacterium 3-367]
MKKIKFLLPIVSMALIFFPVHSQQSKAGPIIENFGKVFNIEKPAFKLDTTLTYKAVFDIVNSPEGHTERNKSLETAARFLNMHAQSGIPKAQLKAALVVHSKASKDLLSDAAYEKRFGVKNPNGELIKALLSADVAIIFCGQSSMARGYPKEDLIPGVQLSLSAMTALIQLQNDNYNLIKF